MRDLIRDLLSFFMILFLAAGCVYNIYHVQAMTNIEYNGIKKTYYNARSPYTKSSSTYYGYGYDNEEEENNNTKYRY